MTIGIVVLNWRNAHETIACLSAVELLEDSDHHTYLVDNGSGDGSVETLESWITDRASAPSPLGRQLGPTRVTLIRSASNRGYAGGNNLGIAAALADGCEGVWVLNNDTLPEPESLSAIRRTASGRGGVGVVGSCLVEMDDPATIQCVGGGSYSWPSSRTTLIGRGAPRTARHAISIAQLSFISGAAMYLPRAAIDTVGALDERYFLFSEEMDYAERCRARGLELRVSRDAIVRHRNGASTGASSSIALRSPMAAYYSTRSVIKLTRRFRWWLLPPVVATRTGLGVLMALTGAATTAAATWRGVLAGLGFGGGRYAGDLAEAPNSRDGETS